MKLYFIEERMISVLWVRDDDYAAGSNMQVDEVRELVDTFGW